MSDHGFKIVARKTVYQNPWIRVEEMGISRHGQPGIYGVVHSNDAVALVVRNKKNQLLMIEQYRFPVDSLCWEVPMGGIDDNESPLEAAKRELFEETGVKAENLEQIAVFHPLPGLVDNRAHLFSAVVDDEEIDKNLKMSDEILSVRFVPEEEVRGMMKDGRVKDGMVLGCLALEELNNKKR